MPKLRLKSLIYLNILHPQGEPQKLLLNIFRWLLSAGRYLIILVEAIVLAAFLLRFKLDADIATTKEAIEEQVPFVESLKSDENLIRQTQFQLVTIKDLRQKSPAYVEVIKKIAQQTPNGVTVNNLNIERQVGKVNLKITGTSLNNSELSSFVLGLRQDKTFADTNLTSVSLDQGLINFSIQASVNVETIGEKKL
ncbi:PilN domain-containing protein [Candidatus Daviesbacteria bacterium]|nr:PilN domain-containing protein [Candidatus Daviesbacteria bacterium]